MSTSVCPFNEDLIKLVQKNPILYDCNLQAYKNDALKFGTWKSIAEQLDEDVEICRRRWRSLRTRYRRELLKIERGVNAGKSKSEKRTWIYFERMGFLHEFLRTKESVAYAIEGLASSDEADENASMVSCKKLKLNGSDLLPENLSLENLNAGLGEDLQESTQLFNGNSCVSAKKTSQFNPDEVMDYSHSWSTSQLARESFEKIKKYKELDEFELFGKLVTAKMRKLKNPTLAQITILNTLNEQEKKETKEND